MSLTLYRRVALKCDFPEEGLRQGDVATLVDYVQNHQGPERRCILEMFNAAGESIAVILVPESEIEELRANQILAVRPLARPG